MLPPPPSSPLFPYTTLFRSPRVPQATGYRDGYVTGGPLCRPGRGGPAQPQEVPMARIGIQLMMLKDHIAEQGEIGRAACRERAKTLEVPDATTATKRSRRTSR